MIGLVFFVLLVVLMLDSQKNVLGQIQTEDYEISVSGINERMRIGNYKESLIIIKNNKLETISVFFSLDGNVTEFLKLSNNRVNIESNSERGINITFFADKLGFHNGTLTISGGVNEVIPINFTVSDIVGLPVEAIIMEIEALTKRVYIGESFRYKVDIQNLLAGESYNITLHYYIDKLEPTKTYESNKSFLPILQGHA